MTGANIDRIMAPDMEIDSRGNPVTVLPPGTVLKDRYEVTYLTAGGMGVIYKAADRDKEFSCIIKELVGRKSVYEKFFIREKEMLAEFYHPGIVNLLDCFQEKGNSYLVLEYVEGLPADEYIAKNYKGGKVPVNNVIHWALQLCNVLLYLHNMNPPVIYRDLKPENILISNDGKVKVIDFGIARTYKEEQIKDTDVVGSFGFASPEQYGARQTDGRSDIYSFGALLHYFLSGIDPRDGENPFDFDFTSLPHDMPVKFRSLVSKALEPETSGRFQSVEEVMAILEELKKDNPSDYFSREEMDNVVKGPTSLFKTISFMVFGIIVLMIFYFYLFYSYIPSG